VVALLLMMKVRATPKIVLVKGKFNFIGQLGSVIAVPWARVVLLTGLVEGVFLLGPMSYLPAYLHVRHGLSLSVSSALIALYAVGGLVYALTARHIVARYGEHRMVLSGGILMGLGFLVLWLSPWWITAGPDALMIGFGTYLFHNTLQTHSTQMVPAARGTSVALFASCLFGGQAIGVSAAGYTFDHFGATPMLLSAAVALPLAGWCFVRALKRRSLA
jgi:predicted MFS family arabinose efflux permease